MSWTMNGMYMMKKVAKYYGIRFLKSDNTETIILFAIFAPDLGWVPVDASCSTKYAKHGLFESLEVNHATLSKGRDIVLAPPQKGEAMLFFYSAYADVDGIKHADTKRNFTFRALD